MLTCHGRPDARRAGRMRGAILIEALVASLVLAIGVSAMAALGLRLQQQAQHALWQSRALHAVQSALDRQAAGAAAVPAPGQEAATPLAVRPDAAPPLAGLHAWEIEVAGAPAASVQMQAISVPALQAAAPRWLDALASAPSRRAVTASTFARHPRIPVHARDLGDGRSLHTPMGASGVAYVFDNLSGKVVALCSAEGAGSTVIALDGCRPITGL